MAPSVASFSCAKCAPVLCRMCGQRVPQEVRGRTAEYCRGTLCKDAARAFSVVEEFLAETPMTEGRRRAFKSRLWSLANLMNDRGEFKKGVLDGNTQRQLRARPG